MIAEVNLFLLILLGNFISLFIQAQSGWVQHDFGHLSVFKKASWNHTLHQVFLGVTKVCENSFFFSFEDNHSLFVQGASADWWNHMHFQHHSKPNVIDKDPDTRIELLFLLGDTIPIRVSVVVFFFFRI